MNRPFVAVVLFYAVGLLIAQWVQAPLVILFSTSFFILAAAVAFKIIRTFLLGALLVLAGWTNLVFHTAVVSPDDLRTLIGDQADIVTVRGILAETPRIKIIERNDQETEHSLAEVKITEICRNEIWQPALGEIIVSTPSTLASNYFAGQNVEISGVIAPPRPPLAEGLFDYGDYLQTRGIYYELKTESMNDWQLRAPILPSPPLTDQFLNWSKRTLALGLPAEDEPLKLLWAMTLGWRTAFSGDIGEPFLRAGTMHMFAIDGLRIALISGMLVALLRVLQISRAWCGAIAIPLIWFYTATTGWESSAIRASVMMTVVLGGWALKRPSDLLNSLAAAAFFILLAEPRQIFEASFQLSFFVMLVIALMLPPMNEFSDRLLKHDPLLPDELLPGWKRKALWLTRKFSRYCVLSFAAWIGSLPLSIKYFHLFSPVSTIANIIAVPLGTFALMANLGALICGTWFPLATELFNQAAWFFMVSMTGVSEAFTKIPGAFFYVPEISWLTVGIYYTVVIILFSGWLKTMRRKNLTAIILLIIAAIYFFRWENSCGETDLTVLPLSGGHAVFVDADGRANDWLIDCGSDKAVEFTLKDFLRAQGVNKIQHLVLTEGDAKNIGGAPSLDGLFGIGELWTSSVNFRSVIYRKTIAGFENSGRAQTPRHKFFKTGDSVSCWKILHPNANNDFPRADDNALVLLGNFHGTKILLLSDLGRVGQDALLSTTNDLRADIVIAGLPNEGEPLCDALLDAIQPKIIIIADSEMPATRRAKRELKERLAAKNMPVIYTRISGAVKIATDKSGWKLTTMDGQN
jgi:ComEC/Rec2-related protein